jgi:O-antigen/teichoic acid export membrane protein
VRSPRVRRAGWSVGDQALSSLSNFGLSVLVARSLDVTAFGAFGLALTTYLLAVGISRALVGDLLVVRHSAGAGAHVAGQAFGAVLVVGLAGAGVLVVVGAVMAAVPIGAVLVVLGLSLPGLLLQDTLRYFFVAIGRPARALANDAIWAGCQAGVLVLLLATGGAGLLTFVGAWAGGATVAAAIGLRQTGQRPRLSGAVPWLRAGGDLWPRFLAEFFATMGAWQLALYLVGGLAGLAPVGALRGAQVLFGPLHVVNYGARLVAVPEGVRARAGGQRDVRRLVAVVLAVLVGIAAGWTAVVVALPDALGRALLGETWPSVAAISLPFGLFMVTEAAVFSIGIGLRILGTGRPIMWSAAWSSALLILVTLVCASSGDVRAVAVGLALAGSGGTILWARALFQVIAATSAAEPEPLENADA